MSTGNNNYSSSNSPDPKHLIELANYRMPFGKYKGELLLKIPEAYFTWFKQKGFPEGKLGNMMREMDELKVNGLEYLLKPFIEKKRGYRLDD